MLQGPQGIHMGSTSDVCGRVRVKRMSSCVEDDGCCVSPTRLIFLDGFADSAPLCVRMAIQQGAHEGHLLTFYFLSSCQVTFNMLFI